MADTNAQTGHTTTANLNGFMYEVYDKIVDPIPESARIFGRIPYKGGALELGNKLHVNVITNDEGGFTHAPAGAGAFKVNTGISLETQDAQVDGFQTLLQSSIDYESAAKASSSRKAFLEIIGKKLQNVVASSKRRAECEMLYGQDNIGVIASADAAVSETIKVYLTAASHAPLLWIGKKGHHVDVFTAGNAVVTGPISQAALGGGGMFRVVSVDVSDSVRSVTLEGLTAGYAGYLKTYVDSNPNTVQIRWALTYFISGSQHRTMKGIKGIASNTGSMFNIDAASVDVWAGNTYDCGSAAFTFKKAMDCLSQLSNRGLDGNVVAWVHPRTWANLATDQAALRRYGAEIREAKNGARSITFDHMTGSVEFIGHGMIKGGIAVFMEMDKWSRVGAQDFSFKTPGLEEGRDIFWHNPDYAGFSYRYYGNMAVFCEMPSHQLLVTNIVNA